MKRAHGAAVHDDEPSLISKKKIRMPLEPNEGNQGEEEGVDEQIGPDLVLSDDGPPAASASSLTAASDDDSSSMIEIKRSRDLVIFATQSIWIDDSDRVVLGLTAACAFVAEGPHHRPSFASAYASVSGSLATRHGDDPRVSRVGFKFLGAILRSVDPPAPGLGEVASALRAMEKFGQTHEMVARACVFFLSRLLRSRYSEENAEIFQRLGGIAAVCRAVRTYPGVAPLAANSFKIFHAALSSDRDVLKSMVENRGLSLVEEALGRFPNVKEIQNESKNVFLALAKTMA